MIKELSLREKEILRIIVQEYNATCEPVGSKKVASLYNQKISSQTIRNSMSNLEKNGYLIKEHVSSGRVPSKKALDYFTNYLDNSTIDNKIINRLQSLFIKRDENIDSVINDSLTLINDITKLPSLKNEINSTETLREVSLVQLNESNALILIVTSVGNIHKNYIYISNQTQFDDVKVCIKLINSHLIGVRIDDIVNKIGEIIPILKKQVIEYEFITREVIYKLFNQTLKNLRKTNVVGMTSLSKYPEFQEPEVIFNIIDMIEKGSIWQQIQHDIDNNDNNNENVKIEFKSINEIDENKVFMIATTNINHDNITRQISVIGPSRTEIGQIKGILSYLKIQIEKMFNK